MDCCFPFFFKTPKPSFDLEPLLPKTWETNYDYLDDHPLKAPGLKKITKEVAKFIIKFFLTLEHVNPINEKYQKEKKLEPDVKALFDEEEKTSEYIYHKAIELRKRVIYLHKELDFQECYSSIEYIAIITLTNTTKDDALALLDFSLVFDLFSSNNEFNKLYKASVWNEELETGFKHLSVSHAKLAEMELEFLKSIDWNLRLTEMNLVDN